MIKINSNSNGFSVEGVNNVFHPDNGTLVFAANTVIMVLDDSEMVTFRSAANNDVLFSGIIGQIQIGGETVTKQNIVSKFDAVANNEGGEPFVPTDYYTKSETNTLLEGKADVSDIPTYLSELTNDAGYITQSEVIINESFPSSWLQALDMEDLIQAINNDSDAKVGKVYMDTISLSDLPAGMQQAEVKAEIMSELEPGGDKVILFTVTSSNTSPYHWEYTSAYGATGTWREWLVSGDIANYFDGAEYDSNSKRINFKHGNTIKTYIDATAFIKDGMVDTVVISNGNLVITFNTDAGKEAITIPLTDIFDPSNYYTKTATDTLLNAKADASSLATVATSGSYNDLLNKPTIPDAYTKTESDNKYLTKAVFDVKEETISAALNDLDTNKQDVLTAGTNITIQNNVISAAGGTQVQADWNETDTSDPSYIQNKPSMDDYYTKTQVNGIILEKEEVVARALTELNDEKADVSDLPNMTNYYTKTETDTAISTAVGQIDLSGYVTKSAFDVKEEVISAALNDLDSTKQDTLTAGSNITITNNVISATGGTQVQSDWNQSDNTAVDYIKNKPTIPDTSNFVERSVYNQKEIAIANALTQLNDNKADKTDVPNMTNYYTKTQTDTAISTAVGQIDLSGYMTTSAFDVKEEVISSALVDLDERIGDIQTILQSI